MKLYFSSSSSSLIILNISEVASASSSAQLIDLTTTPTPTTTTTTATGDHTPQPEKRLKRHRCKPTISISQRISRALTQRLYLIQTSPIERFHSQTNPHGPSMTFTVLGSTGNVYKVTLSKLPKCTCPDSQKGKICKHFLFVMLKIVGLETNSNLVYQNAYLTNELEELYELVEERKRRLGYVEANDAVKKTYAKVENGHHNEDDVKEEEKGVKRKDLDDDCPICFEPLLPSSGKTSSSTTATATTTTTTTTTSSLITSTSLITFCSFVCGQNFHSECIKMWTSQHRNNPTCPSCRQPWMDPKTGGGKKRKSSDMDGGGDEGFVNLGSLQGQSRVRDTSTYNNYHNDQY